MSETTLASWSKAIKKALDGERTFSVFEGAASSAQRMQALAAPRQS